MMASSCYRRVVFRIKIRVIPFRWHLSSRHASDARALPSPLVRRKSYCRCSLSTADVQVSIYIVQRRRCGHGRGRENHDLKYSECAPTTTGRRWTKISARNVSITFGCLAAVATVTVAAVKDLEKSLRVTQNCFRGGSQMATTPLVLFLPYVSSVPLWLCWPGFW